MQIDLDPQVAHQLLALAKAQGVTVEALLKDFVEHAKEIYSLDKTPKPTLEEFEEDMDFIALGLEHLQPLPQDFSRADIYADHD